jgi:acetyl-CoA carboxylase biotin carboxylase subunit
VPQSAEGARDILLPPEERRVFKKVLVANRGEIAVRVMRACRDLGIGSVAVYSEPDATALHARYADEAYCIGAGPASESYLSAAKVIDAALKSGADAIHPGYGFLSERSEFARACADADITFIGPRPESLHQLGDKVEARIIADRAGVPTVPGTPDRVDLEEAREAAKRIGFPVLIKAAGGGGGKGIRLVKEEAELETSLRTAAAEAEANFGDGGLYVEKYLDPVRHIEVQILADRFGNVVHLGERECSVQRRSQKLVEESPSPAVSPELRARLGAAAVSIAKEAGYENAGTVEFLFDDATGNFYFIEVNARLQVEHPVTELVTGLDLIREQLRVASGEPLGFTQDDVKISGWAIECRITAEDAEGGFLPSVGKVDLLCEPSGPGVRVDSSLFPGMEVGQFYDSLLSKAVAYGRDRDEALRRMRRALDEYEILGVKTTLGFHRQLMAHPDFISGNIETHFLERSFNLKAPEATANDTALVVAALLSHSRRNSSAAPATRAASNGNSSLWRTTARAEALRDGGGASWRNIS